MEGESHDILLFINLNIPARYYALEHECKQNQVGIVTVPPREGAGRQGTSTSEGTLHHIHRLNIDPST